MPYVYSTLTNDTFYNDYHKPVEGSMVREINRKVLVKGGTGVANKQLMTPLGVATRVSDEDADFLEKNEAFNRHRNGGFVTIRPDDVHPEKVAADMETRDGASPRVPGDFTETDLAKPAEGSAKSFMDRVKNSLGV